MLFVHKLTLFLFCFLFVLFLLLFCLLSVIVVVVLLLFFGSALFSFVFTDCLQRFFSGVCVLFLFTSDTSPRAFFHSFWFCMGADMFGFG